MIESLRIRDLVLVDDLHLEFERGFAALTGETGAGKSVLLQGLGLLLGDRASRDLVREGRDQARVEGVFWPEEATRAVLAALLEAAGVPWEPGEPLIVARSVGADGRSRAHINGAAVPVSLLAEVGERLVEVASQHQHQGLLREDLHLALLDAAVEGRGDGVRARYAAQYAAWRAAQGEVERLRELQGTAQERAELLRRQVAEIRALGLEEGEETALRAERDLLAHAEKLVDLYGAAEEALYSASGAAVETVGRASRVLEDARGHDPAASEILELLAEVRGPLDEAAFRVRERRQRLAADPGRLEVVETRLDQIRRLERSHGPGTESILAALERLQRELDELEENEFALDAAERRQQQGAAALETLAGELSAARRTAAAELEQRVARELGALAMDAARFEVEVARVEPSASGCDAVRFLLQANPGEPSRPLARVASGGELSRLALALKNALRDTRVDSLVFDEVDAGIGGAVADAVGERLARLADTCQVLCITHLPQIASRAARHYRVEKVTRGGRTVTRVQSLDVEQRVQELARMLGGAQITDAILGHARELAERSAS